MKNKFVKAVRKIAKTGFSLLAAMALFVTAVPVSAAESDITTTTGQMEIPVTIKSASTYEIAIPKKITLIKGTADSFPINVKGDLAVDEKLVITTSPTMTMEQSGTTKTNVEVTPSLEKSIYAWSEITGGGCASKVNVDTTNLSAGKWSGACAVNVVISTLPDGYIPVSYLEGSGEQYIDTEYVLPERTWNDYSTGTVDIEINCDFEHNWSTNHPDNAGYCIYGCLNYSTNAGPAMRQDVYTYDNSKRRMLTFVANTENDRLYKGDCGADFRGNSKLNNSGWYMDGTYIGNEYWGTSDCSMYIFSNNNNGTPGTPFPGKIYSFSILKNGIAEVNMVPCKELSSGELGMYDTVRKQFYGNAGTGTFTCN